MCGGLIDEWKTISDKMHIKHPAKTPVKQQPALDINALVRETKRFSASMK